MQQVAKKSLDFFPAEGIPSFADTTVFHKLNCPYFYKGIGFFIALKSVR